MFQETWRCSLKNIDNSVIYLVPLIDNEVFSINDESIKEILPPQAKTRKDVYLVNYIFMVILNSFYLPGQDLVMKPYREFLTLTKLEEEVSTRLKDATERIKNTPFQNMAFNEDESLEIEFRNISEVEIYWSSKLVSKEKGKSSRIAFLKSVIKFMVNQGLADYDSPSEKFFPTTRLSAILQHVCYTDRERILNLLAVEPKVFEEEIEKESENLMDIPLNFQIEDGGLNHA